MTTPAMGAIVQSLRRLISVVRQVAGIILLGR